MTLIHSELRYVHTDDWNYQLFDVTGNDITFHMVISLEQKTQLRRIIWDSSFTKYHKYHLVFHDINSKQNHWCISLQQRNFYDFTNRFIISITIYKSEHLSQLWVSTGACWSRPGVGKLRPASDLYPTRVLYDPSTCFLQVSSWFGKCHWCGDKAYQLHKS